LNSLALASHALSFCSQSKPVSPISAAGYSLLPRVLRPLPSFPVSLTLFLYEYAFRISQSVFSQTFVVYGPLHTFSPFVWSPQRAPGQKDDGHPEPLEPRVTRNYHIRCLSFVTSSPRRETILWMFSTQVRLLDTFHIALGERLDSAFMYVEHEYCFGLGTWTLRCRLTFIEVPTTAWSE
jgi:hypothetical protein